MNTLFFEHYKKKQKMQMRQNVMATYSNICIPITTNMVYLYRKHNWDVNSTDLDIHSRYWSVAFFKEDCGEITVHRLGEIIKISRDKILLIPPYSMLQWNLVRGEAQWEAFICRTNIHPMASEPMLYDFPSEIPVPKNETDLLHFITHLKSGIKVGYQLKNSIVAEKVKRKLDQSFPNFPLMSELAESMNLKLPSLDREFRLTYSLSPREYNVRQRTLATSLNSFFTINTPIKQIASEMGFHHMGNFHKQCLRYLNATPSQLKSKKMDSNLS